MSLNKEQIQEVVNWLNTWGQLKNGVVPIRFKEDFEKQLAIPEVGVMLPTNKQLTFNVMKNDNNYRLTLTFDSINGKPEIIDMEIAQFMNG